MKRFKNILLVADGRIDTKTPLQRAVILARENDALLTVVEVLWELPRNMQMAITSIDIAHLKEIAIQERSKNLETLVAPIRREGVNVNCKVLYGTPFLEIIREVLRNGHDLVILRPEGRGRLREILFGSTTMHLMRKCPCPVWVIKPTRRKKYARILAAVDPVPFHDERDALNKKIMEMATSLAEMEASQLHVIHCWERPLESHVIGHSGLVRREFDRLVREIRKHHKTWLKGFLDEFNLDVLNHQVHLVTGDPGKQIPEMAKKKRIELIVMGTVCRTGVAGFFIGNTAERVLSEVDCSVLTVKPDGFVSPVTLE